MDEMVKSLIRANDLALQAASTIPMPTVRP